MNKLLGLSVLLLTCAVAQAGNGAVNVLPGEQVTSAAGACHEATVGDVRLSWGALSVANISASNVGVKCSPQIDLSSNGTKMFGAVITNRSASARTVTCTAEISSGGYGASKVLRSVVVGGAASARIGWDNEDMGFQTLMGGQVGLTCTLPPGTSLSWVWSTNVHN